MRIGIALDKDITAPGARILVLDGDGSPKEQLAALDGAQVYALGSTGKFGLTREQPKVYGFMTGWFEKPTTTPPPITTGQAGAA